jgi:hypothetical protein
MLFVEVQALTRGDEHRDVGRSVPNLRHNVGAIQQVLEVVEYEQQRFAAQVVDHLLLRGTAVRSTSLQTQVKRVDKCRHDVCLVGQDSQRHEEDTIRKADVDSAGRINRRMQVAFGGSQRQARLAHPARAHNRGHAHLGRGEIAMEDR